MFRTVCAIVSVMTVVLLAPTLGLAQSDSIVPGKELKLTLTEKVSERYMDVFGYEFFRGEFKIHLEVDQTISLSATMKGDDRPVFLRFLDPDGVVLGAMKGPAKTTGQLKVGKVAVSGDYKIVVQSDRRGDFTLRATTTPMKQPDENKLKEKIEQLQQELAEAKEQLEALKAKRTKDPE